MLFRKTIATSIFFLAFLFASAQWTPLFDGKSLRGWLFSAPGVFSVSGGTITASSGPGSKPALLTADKPYGDFALELDVKAGPGVVAALRLRGGPGFNPVRGYRVSIAPASSDYSGGLYDDAGRGALYPASLSGDAAKDAFSPAGFNHLRVECAGPAIKTWVNGVLTAYVIDSAYRQGALSLEVDAAAPGDPGGRKIVFKNIRLATKDWKPESVKPGVYVVNNTVNQLSDYEKASGWRLLFNGTDSAGWVSAHGDFFPHDIWKIENGTICVLDGSGAESNRQGDLVTREEFGAFDLSFEFRLTPGANSGVKYFVTLNEKTAGSAIGLEYQILDDSLHPDAKLGRDGDRTLASLYDLIPAAREKRFLHPVGQWNQGRVVVYPNNHVEHYLNGFKVLEYERGSAKFRELVAISKYKVWPGFGEAPKGHILLQDHGNNVCFRSVKIRELK